MDICMEFLHNIIAEQVAWVDVAWHSIFFMLVSSHPWMKASSGYLLKKHLHVQLSDPSISQPLMSNPVLVNASLLPLTIPTSTVILFNGLSGLRNANKHEFLFCWKPTTPTSIKVNAIICWNHSTPMHNLPKLECQHAPLNLPQIIHLPSGLLIHVHSSNRMWEEQTVSQKNCTGSLASQQHL